VRCVSPVRSGLLLTRPQKQGEQVGKRRSRIRRQAYAPRLTSVCPSAYTQDAGGPPPAEQTRVWHDRTGQFRVEAAFLGYRNGMIRLHKVNGVVIEVPSEKMSIEDMTYVDKATRPGSAASGSSPAPRRVSEDDAMPLAVRQQSLISSNAPAPSRTTSGNSQKKEKKGPTIDWFEFFLGAGCDLDDCTRYASSFERDKIDEALLPDITEGTMRSLGLREGVSCLSPAASFLTPSTPVR
jgi:hypothetical protein